MSTPAEKAILVTGTSRGIGFHLCTRLLDLGYRVAGISRSGTPLRHPRFMEIRADLSKPEDVAALRERVRDLPLHGLINNAGIHGPIGPFEANDFAQWVAAFQVNLFSAAGLAHMCIPALRKHRGFIIFLSGGGSGFARPNFSSYGVAKTAVVRLAEVLARELAPDVLVYCVAPGPNRTALLDEAIRGGEVVPPGDIVDFDYPLRLFEFLVRNTDPRYSGKFIHVKDNYMHWQDPQFAPDAYTLRRIKA
jgi:NAD(P)-dependent dehydrogenase (short-subunit alcohol dehydrogenase family)